MFLISCLFFYILIGTDALPMGAVLPDTIDPSSVVEMSGWGVSFPPNFPSTSIIPLARAASGKDCLAKCHLNEFGCRLAAFDLNTRACTGYKEGVEGTFVRLSNYSSPKNLPVTFIPGQIVPQNILFYTKFVPRNFRSSYNFVLTLNWHESDHRALNANCESHLTCQTHQNPSNSLKRIGILQIFQNV